MFASIGSRRTALAFLALEITASAAAAQAKIEQIIGQPTGAVVQRAGALEGVPAAVDSVLQPGDMLRTDPITKVELRCTTQGAPIYRIAGGFRGYIDVPFNNRCTVAVAEGHADVIAEDTTSTIGGTIALASKGTQYAVDVAREGRTFACNVAVYEGEVFSRGGAATAAQGSTLEWVGRALKAKGTVQAAEIERSAALYASFDVAAARTAGATQADTTYQQLKALHYEVLAHPTDTAKRVELAKRQIAYKVDQQAAYNLKRANVRDDRALQQYDIDPRTVRNNRVLREGVYRTSRADVQPDRAAAAAAGLTAVETTRAAKRAAVQPYRATTPADAARTTRVEGAAGGDVVTAAPVPAPPPPAYAGPTTDSDLQLIAAGNIDEAIRNLEARVATPAATARDHYALARAYAGRDMAKVRAHASQAIKLQAADGRLNDAELQQVRELLVAAR